MKKELFAFIFIFVILWNSGLACFGRNKKGKKKETPTKKEKETPANDDKVSPTEEQLELMDDLGIEKVDEDSGRGYLEKDGLARSSEDLQCNFETSRCCWKNVDSPRDTLEFLRIKAQKPPKAKAVEYSRELLDTGDPPSGKFLGTFVEKGDDYDGAIYESCTIQSTCSDFKVQLKHWTTNNVNLEACVGEVDGRVRNFVDCKTFTNSNPGPSSVILPAMNNSKIWIKATGFEDPIGLAILDDLKVDYEPCGGRKRTTRRPNGTSTTPRPAPVTGPGKGVCDVVTDFNEGAGAWSSKSPAVPNANAEFKPESTLVGNPFTGVRPDRWHPEAEAEKFLAAYLEQNTIAATESTEFTLNKDAELEFWFWEAIKGTVLKACIDNENNCPFETERPAKAGDLAWRQGKIPIKKSAKAQKVLFICDNQKSISQGACGISKVEFRGAPGTPDSGKSLCP